jgi:hypothetical protein
MDKGSLVRLCVMFQLLTTRYPSFSISAFISAGAHGIVHVLEHYPVRASFFRLVGVEFCVFLLGL